MRLIATAAAAAALVASPVAGAEVDQDEATPVITREALAAMTQAYNTAWTHGFAVLSELHQQYGERWRMAAVLDACGEHVPEALAPLPSPEEIAILYRSLFPDETGPDRWSRVMLVTNALKVGYEWGYSHSIRVMIESGTDANKVALVCATGREMARKFLND